MASAELLVARSTESSETPVKAGNESPGTVDIRSRMVLTSDMRSLEGEGSSTEVSDDGSHRLRFVRAASDKAD